VEEKKTIIRPDSAAMPAISVPAQRGVIRLISVTLLCDVDHADCGLAIGQ
jgi:hypothetical protein